MCIRNLCLLALSFVLSGFTTVIDWVVPDRQQLDLFYELLDPLPIRAVIGPSSL